MLTVAAPMEGRPFRLLFERWARYVRRRLALRMALTGAALGLLLGIGVSAALWKARQGALRPLGATGGVVGAMVGLAASCHRRWSDVNLALYLDARLQADEIIATAVERCGSAPPDDGSTSAWIVSQAAGVLAEATPTKVRPPLLHPWHATMPFAAAAMMWISIAPLPPASTLPTLPGASTMKLADVKGLDKILHLARLPARDNAQRERLTKLAEDAKTLRDKLKNGVEKRDAQSDLAHLRDRIQAEKLSLGDGEQRQGMDIALGKLGDDNHLKGAQKALGDRDLVSLDDVMERLANQLEKSDRERAQTTLVEAGEAARKNGAPGVAKALEEEVKRLAEAGDKADQLRELAKELGDALGKEDKQASRDFGRTGRLEEQRRLVEQLNQALGRLTPQERKRLAENLSKKLASAADRAFPQRPSKEQLRHLIEQLETPDGHSLLEEELRRMAEPPADSEEGERQRRLAEAEEGAEEIERGLGGVPMPQPIEGARGKGQPSAPANLPKGDGPAGHREGSVPGGEHKGVTRGIEGGELKARVSGRFHRGVAVPSGAKGRVSGRVGEPANVRGTSALGQAAPGELGGIERSDVPEEYREQVGRYFAPQ